MWFSCTQQNTKHTCSNKNIHTRIDAKKEHVGARRMVVRGLCCAKSMLERLRFIHSQSTSQNAEGDTHMEAILSSYKRMICFAIHTQTTNSTTFLQDIVDSIQFNSIQFQSYRIVTPTSMSFTGIVRGMEAWKKDLLTVFDTKSRLDLFSPRR